MQLFMRFGCAISLVVILLLSGCANLGKLPKVSAGMAQTPITETPSGKNYPGKFVWHDLITPDAVAAGTFYEELFGWQVEYNGNYAVVRHGGKLIAGILQVDPADDQKNDGFWIPSVSVADVDVAAAQVTAGGGKILNGPVAMGIRGRAVLISDPQMAELVLLTATGGDPVDTETGIGDWLWDEIWTNDPEVTGTFYRSVLGYDVSSVNDKYDVFIREGKWRAGVRQVRDDGDYMLWVPIVRVADPEVTVQRVDELGGTVLVEPKNAPNVGNTALIADPTGALLLVQRWSSQLSTSKE